MILSLVGPAVFAALALIGGLALIAIVRGLLAPRTARRFQAALTKPPMPRPCAVYEIDLADGRRYIGYGFHPHQRIMQTHRRTAWFKLTVTAQHTMEPDRIDWYVDEDTAHREEVRRIRAAAPGSLVNKILYKEGAA
jgi:hypothetical protein